MRTLEIPINKSRLVNLAIILVLSIIICVYLSYDLYLEGKYSVKLIILLIVVILFLLFFVWSNCKKIYDKKPGLVIDSRGVLDNMNLSQIGIIPWSSISDVSLVKHQYSEILLVHLKDNQTLLNRLNGFSKFIAKSNSEKFGTPCVIFVNHIKIDKLELLSLFKNNIH